MACGADGDNDSDGFDFLAWQRQYGSPPAVSEPATLTRDWRGTGGRRLATAAGCEALAGNSCWAPDRPLRWQP
jgi:hypothetical protein